MGSRCIGSIQLSSAKKYPDSNLSQWCCQTSSQDVNVHNERIGSEPLICSLTEERIECDHRVHPYVNNVLNISDISPCSSSELHCFNPLDVCVKPFEMTPDDIILWNDRNSYEIVNMDEEEEQRFYKFASGMLVKDDRAILLSDFEKQMILLADGNNTLKVSDVDKGPQKPSNEHLDKVYNVLRETVCI